MSPEEFPECNINLHKPENLEESQCQDLMAYKGTIEHGSLEGAKVIVTAWRPTEIELNQLIAGGRIYVAFIGGVPPHYLTTEFDDAINPA